MIAKLPVGYFDMSRDELSALPIQVARAVFRAHLERASYFVEKAQVIEFAKSLQPTAPADWIVAIRSIKCACEHCGGSGIYSWGACVNGVMSHSGDCFRCNGKGKLNFDDMRRCNIYDRYAICRAFSG